MRFWSTSGDRGSAGIRGLATTVGLALAVAALGLAEPVRAQQQGAVTGRVTNSQTGEPLSGVQVNLQGTQYGALTGSEGRYRITNVPAGQHTVQARLIGYSSQSKQVQVSAGQTATANFRLRTSAVEMDQIVVTGTAGQSRRKEIGNSISAVTTDQIENQPVTNMTDVLQGRTAGVTINTASGQVGAASTIDIRGTNSLAGGSQGQRPLIYVNGIRISNVSGSNEPDEVNQSVSGLDDINPENIERIEVVRGPAATTLYGAEASSGVIQIFTKQGSEGAARWNFSTTQGINRWGRHVGPAASVNPAGLGINDCTGQSDPLGRWSDPSCPADGDWLSLGHTQDYNLSVRGGGEDFNYYLSSNYGDKEGVIDPQLAQEWGIRGNFGFTPAANLNVRLQTQYTNRNITWVPDGNNAEGMLLNVFRGGKGYTPNGNNAAVLEMDLRSEIDHLITGLNATWTPSDQLSHRLKIGLDYRNQGYQEEKPFRFFLEPEGSRETDDFTNSVLTFDYSGTWSTNLGGLVDGLDSDLSWGGQIFQKKEYRHNTAVESFAGPGPKDLDSGARTSFVNELRTTVVNGGLFVQEQLSLNDLFFVTGGLRVDGNSTFGENYGVQTYPKINSSYVLSDYDWWPDWWGTMKVRAAYGASGKSPGPFDAQRTYTSVSGDNGQPGVTPGQLGAPNLGPERTTELEAGFDASMFSDRLSLSLTYYDQTTEDALISVQPVPSKGFTQNQVRNVGKLAASGLELDATFGVVQSEELDWNVDFLYSNNDTEIKDLGGLERIYAGWGQYWDVGERAPVHWGPVVQNPGAVGEDPVYENEVIGPSHPTWQWSVGTDVNIGDHLTLSARGEARGGHNINSGPSYQGARRSRWPLCDPIQQKIQNEGTGSVTALQQAKCNPPEVRFYNWIEEATFFKLRSLTFTYRLPDALLTAFGPVRSASLTLAGNNLFSITDYPGIDPEALEDGADDDAAYRQEYYNIPPTQGFTAKLRIGF